MSPRRFYLAALFIGSIKGPAMANTSSAKKATRGAARRAAVNKSRLTNVRSSVRTVEEAILSGNKSTAEAALSAAGPKLMKGAQKGVMHKNAASRKVSRLTKRVKAMA
jgi:small subunit ribosomal protein S20